MSTEPNETKTVPDPSTLTTQQEQRGIEGIERELGQRQETRERDATAAAKLMEAQLDGLNVLNAEKIASIRREIDIREAHRMETARILEAYRQEINSLLEAHRLELRAGDEKALTTALTAAKEAVREALAASEKARDQQTLANQLSADKTERAFEKAMAAMAATFTTSITGLIDGLGEVKSAVITLTSEKRGGQEQVVDRRAGANLWVGIFAGAVAFAGIIIAAVAILVR